MLKEHTAHDVEAHGFRRPFVNDGTFGWYLLPQTPELHPAEFESHLRLDMLTPVMEAVYSYEASDYINPDEVRERAGVLSATDDIADPVVRRVMESRMKRHSEQAHSLGAAEAGTTLFYDPSDGQIKTRGVTGGQYGSVHLDIYELIDSGMYPVAVVHRHPEDSPLGPADYVPFLQRRYNGSLRMAKAILALSPGFQEIAIATECTAPVREDSEVIAFLNRWEDRFTMIEQDALKRYTGEYNRVQLLWKQRMDEGLEEVERLDRKRIRTGLDEHENAYLLSEVERLNAMALSGISLEDTPEVVSARARQVAELREGKGVAFGDLVFYMGALVYRSTNMRDFFLV